MAYSGQRTDSNLFVLALGWGAFMGAGVVAMYCLGNALWLNNQERAAHDAD
ncbi:hypothetical protein [Streptomyces sp. NPDC101178]|uniref:hypothetical protein n=1 Tax=Streptomyces sp. NPDC101178 TaxID=3366124 RepID=UPI0037F688BC